MSTGGNTVTVANPGGQSGAVGTAISGLQIQGTDSAGSQTLTYAASGLPAGLSISWVNVPFCNVPVWATTVRFCAPSVPAT